MSDVRAQKDEALINTAWNGHLDVIKYLVSQGANVRAQGDEALIYAAWGGHLDVVKYLVSQGANVHAREDSALISAAQTGRLNVVKYLVSQGADVRAQQGKVLTRAAWRGHSDAAKNLISNAYTREDRALIDAALDRHLDLLRFLLDTYGNLGPLRSHPEAMNVIGKINHNKSIISSSLRAGTNIANLISTYY